MGFFKKQTTPIATNVTDQTAELAARVLDSIAEGVILVDANGIIQFANPAAATLAGYGTSSNIVGLDIHYILKLENAEGAPIAPEENTFFNALATNQSLSTRDFLLVSASGEQRIAVSLTCTPTGGPGDYRIITFCDVTTELAKEHEREDFISTASHEMRTPVASIEGYLGLALNPQTATVDTRAKQYLEEAHKASEHLGQLFKDLLDVTKIGDHRLRPHLVPVDAVEAVKKISDECAKMIPPRKLKYTFGTNAPSTVTDKKHIEPKVYMNVDMDFLQAILENLIGNAIKYTPDGGEIWVNARGDGDKVLINVTDTGIGISADDIPHLFQKFYRVDNSQTRQIGGTGLGLFLVKERVDAMGGRVWAESAFGDGSTFFVSLPRISDADYQKLSIAHANEQMVQNFATPNTAQPVFQPITPIASANTPATNAPTANIIASGVNAEKIVGTDSAKIPTSVRNHNSNSAVNVSSMNSTATDANKNINSAPGSQNPASSTPVSAQTPAPSGDLALALEAAKKALEKPPTEVAEAKPVDVQSKNTQPAAPTAQTPPTTNQ